jgi:iron complex transport system ATP-binding protein
MSEALLSVSGVSFSYNAARVLQGVSFDADTGGYISLVGPNGSGKTTLFHILSGCYAPETGAARLYGREVRKIPVQERATIIALVAQRQSLDFPFTCLESVLLGLHPHRARFEAVRSAHLELARDIMRKTDVWQFAEKPVTALSGGEMQRVILARALVQRPKLLLLDEAMSGLDISARIAMLKLLRRTIAETGLTVIAVHHDLTLAYRYSDRVLALHGGRIAANGRPEEVFTKEFFQKVFLVDAEIIPGKGFFIHDNIQASSMGRSPERK